MGKVQFGNFSPVKYTFCYFQQGNFSLANEDQPGAACVMTDGNHQTFDDNISFFSPERKQEM